MDASDDSDNDGIHDTQLEGSKTGALDDLPEALIGSPKSHASDTSLKSETESERSHPDSSERSQPEGTAYQLPPLSCFQGGMLSKTHSCCRISRGAAEPGPES